ncbi:hypothetical protein KKC88_06115 [Patescibacteria group bacterium]|nr:hypothetical protein [Patescibacteria group bacterium]MBU1673941.1 hypothetical protein [Patescibacteria group bacterium]MBU1963935.1 hypothetical protein [Patescibacteria group bacterium]
MLNNFIVGAALIAQLTGLGLPAVLVEETFYIPPTYDQVNDTVLEIEPSPRLPLAIPPPKKITESNGPEDIGSRAAIAVDKNSGKILWQKNAEEPMPIASITKLMNVLVFLDHNPGWNHMHSISNDENWLIGARLPAGEGEQFSTYDLLRTALVGSRNNAALALAHSTEISDDIYKQLMNEKARMLGMNDSTFVEPTGLEEGNQSTAQDLVKLAKAAFARDVIREPLGMDYHRMKRTDSDEEIAIKNTNKLITWGDAFMIGGKTGYTDEAGFCLLSLNTDEWGHEIIVAVLGVEDDNERFYETQDIVEWVYNNYNWE